MKVADLVKVLSTVDQDADIFIETSGGFRARIKIVSTRNSLENPGGDYDGVFLITDDIP